MTTDKIIAAAREAGIEFQKVQGITGRVRTTSCGSQPIEKFARFYAIAYRAGMERAAEICDKRGGQFFDESPFAVECHQLADSIRAHAQNQPKPIHDSSVV